MLIHGLQKLTLLDYPGKVACTVFTGGCNFRCPFCHNASLVLRPDEGEHIPEEELFALLKKRQGVLEGVCITGGEPPLAFGLEKDKGDGLSCQAGYQRHPAKGRKADNRRGPCGHDSHGHKKQL